MMKIKTDIIPRGPRITSIKLQGELDLKAICVFSAIGFFLDDDTYWTHKKVLKPATVNQLDNTDCLNSSESYFDWHYAPRNITFDQALDEFTSLFEIIINEQTKARKVILPLSGGLDSRTQATALKYLGADVNSYSYEFENGYAETKIAKQIAAVCGFDFQSFQIKKGYLWDNLGDLAKLNHCYSDFTSPRQMAIATKFKTMGDVFSLGHWGDVLFDSYNSQALSHDEQVAFLSKKLLKRGGLEFASNLWDLWQLEGDFKAYFFSRISDCLKTIIIENTNAKLRAFKSKYWAPRWTSVNLSVFTHYKPITLPYYDNRMCEFICTIPEQYLMGRQLQIAYIKKRNPELAKLIWQDKRPYNLYNYERKNAFKTLSYKVVNKIERSVKTGIRKPYVQRNWELQFMGKDNRKALETVLDDSKLRDLIPQEFIKSCVSKFYNGDALLNAHALNMLLVLAKFNQTRVHV